jgi:hypothetical protein
MMVSVPLRAPIADQVDPSSRLSGVSSLSSARPTPKRHLGHRVPEPGQDITPAGAMRGGSLLQMTYAIDASRRYSRESLS